MFGRMWFSMTEIGAVAAGVEPVVGTTDELAKPEEL
jgi:hypothetical protein